jgi:hypothetical protein
MNLSKKNFTITIFPFLIVAWGIFMLIFSDPFYSKSSDPEYPYLVNGLNCALLHFNRIGHIDHPGTPFQLFNGIVIRITHLISGKGNIVQDVFSRPEHYLNAISIAMLLVQSLLIFGIGMIGIKKKIPLWQIAILQASCFFNEVLTWLFCRVNPDHFFMIVSMIFITVYLKYGYENRSSRKFAVWSGVIMALGLATKFNFLPLLILPLFIIDTNKNRLFYAGSGIVSFFIFIAPIIDKFDDYQRFLSSIFKHDGLYGGGEAKVLNLHKMMDSIGEIFKLNPVLYLLIVVLIITIFLAIRKRKEERMNGFIFIFAGFLIVMILQMLMVSKHFKNYYLAPFFSLYGFIFFYISIFLSKQIKKKSLFILASFVLPFLFILLTVGKVKSDYSIILKQIDHREKIRDFVDTEILKADFWFVEPTWESGPYVENALVYGLSYCGHRNDYLPQLMAVNPNIITYEENKDQVKLWRCAPVSLDSVVITGKNIYIYSTPGRKASVLIQILQDVATRDTVQLQIDTIYNDVETENRIIRTRGINTNSSWETKDILVTNRQIKIENFIVAIKNSPEWLEKVKEKADKRNIPLDSMILLDAIWMVEHGEK